jgi:hypothetical protein
MRSPAKVEIPTAHVNPPAKKTAGYFEKITKTLGNMMTITYFPRHIFLDRATCNIDKVAIIKV